MLSTVNANRFINTVAIPLVIIAYAVFLWIDHNRSHDDPDIKIHLQNIKNIGGVDGLVFGGSNAIFSLSAESLSYFTGVKWYNASVSGELFSIERHKNFIKNFSARIDRMKVRYVVYSSLIPYEIGQIAKVESDGKGIEGPRIKPHKSVLAYIHDRIKDHKHPWRDSYGDLVFDDRVTCDFSKDRTKPHEREAIDVVVDFLVEMASFFTSVFPYATLQIVLPSEYYGHSFEDSIFEQSVRSKFYGVLRQKHLRNSMVKIIFQPPYPSIAQVCWGGTHANEDGRLWRTQNLIEFMH
jgi:hypothetical protein